MAATYEPDIDALPEEYFEGVEQLQKQWRLEDRAYLQNHPELRAIMRVLMIEALEQKPTNIFQFAAELFHPEHIATVSEKINVQLDRVKEKLQKSNTADFEPKFRGREASVMLIPNPDEILRFVAVDPPNKL